MAGNVNVDDCVNSIYLKLQEEMGVEWAYGTGWKLFGVKHVKRVTGIYWELAWFRKLKRFIASYENKCK